MSPIILRTGDSVVLTGANAGTLSKRKINYVHRDRENRASERHTNACHHAEVWAGANGRI